MLTFEEYSLTESFGLSDTKPKSLIPSEYRREILRYLTPNSNKSMDNMLGAFEGSITVFVKKFGSREYLYIFARPKGKQYYELHFNDMDYIDNFDDIGLSQKVSMEIFSFGRDVILESSPQNDRSSFYLKLSHKLISLKNLDYTATIIGSKVLLKSIGRNTKKVFTENYNV